MATFALRRFARPEVLGSIGPPLLLALLTPYRRYLMGRGVRLPLKAAHGTFNYTALAAVLVSPDANTPPALIDTLYYIDEMSTPEGMDALLAAVHAAGLILPTGKTVSPADVAVQVWLVDQSLLERKHAEFHVDRPRTFESYQTARSPVPPYRPADVARIARLEANLNDWFDTKNRGRGTRVFQFDRPDGVWFLVRHGSTLQREESLNGSRTGSVCYRPARYDVVVYLPTTGELRVNACSKSEKDLYRREFDRLLFDDADAFPGTDKYTLAPLRTSREACLACADIPGIAWVKLREVQLYHTGAPWLLETMKSDDLFQLLASRHESFPDAGRIVRATFQIKFDESKTPRTVVIKPSNVAQFTRDGDGPLVESWLAARGFVTDRGTDDDGQPEPIFVGG